MVIGPKIGALINDIPISNNLLMTQNSRLVYCKLSQLELLVVKNGNVILRIQNLLMKAVVEGYRTGLIVGLNVSPKGP